MGTFARQIEDLTGTTCPQSLIDLVESDRLRSLCPVTLQLPHVERVLEIQYLHKDVADQKNFDKINQRVEFAINCDGYPLLVDLTSSRLEILQREDDEVYSLGVGVDDLLNSISNRQYTTYD